MKIKRFEDIKAWQLSEQLAIKVYKLNFKTCYGIDIGLKDQIQRASISVMSNIAEGFERGSNKDFIKFLYFSKGSCGEVRSLLHISYKIGYIEESLYLELLNLTEEISKALSGFIKYLSKK